jgi:pimeloyl-ACP methyl ester carboxylesterase
MPFVTNQGVRIYHETIGNGPVLVMHHGTFGSGADWIDCGYVDALKADHQLILLDAWGHGQSDKPHDPKAYDLALRASDVLSVLDALGIQKADYFGYSLGGWIGFGLAKRALERFGSFIFVGVRIASTSGIGMRRRIGGEITIDHPGVAVETAQPVDNLMHDEAAERSGARARQNAQDCGHAAAIMPPPLSRRAGSAGRSPSGSTD